MEWLIALCFFTLVVLWALLWRRLNRIESQLHQANQLEQQVGALAARLYRLENRAAKEPAAPEPASVREDPPLITPSFPPVVNPEPVPVHVSEPRLSGAFQTVDWEALVGGSILNKLGALVLVVGLALFLAYSYTYLGPAGRAAISALLSAALLATGIRVERLPRFRTFAYGVIGAGWAGLYATAYAMYALPAARVIHDPFAGSLLLLAVGVAMVSHSLHYKVQAVTSVALFTPFAALAAAPSTPFALISLIPLAAALLYLAWRFAWYRMALFGLAATWGACVAHGSASATLATAESLLLVYWLLFELFDLFRIHHKITDPAVAWLGPLNAIAFIGLSFSAWQTHAPDRLWIGSGWAAGLFLASALARLKIGGRFESSLTLAAAFCGLSILGRAEGLWASAALAGEAELLFLAGWRFRLRFVRGLGLAAFLVSLIDIALSFGTSQSVLLPGITVQHATPPLLFDTFLFYVNRRLWKPAWYFSSAAAVLLCIVLFKETTDGYIGLAFAGFALVLFEIARRTHLPEFHIQFYLVSLAALITLIVFHVGDLHHAPPASAWISSLGAALVCWWVTFQTWHEAPPKPGEQAPVRDISVSIGAMLALAAFWMVLPQSLVALASLALASLALGIAWVEAGMALDTKSFSLLGAGIAAVASLEILVTDSSLGGKAIWLGNGIPFLGGLYYIWFRWRHLGADLVRLGLSLVALLLLTIIVYVEVSGGYRTVVWGIEGVAVLTTGLAIRERSLRLEGLAVLLACILKLFLYDLRNLETIYRILSFIVLGLILLGVSWIYTRFRERLRQYL